MPLERVKQFKDLTIHYRGSAATFKFYSDLPGGSMAVRRTLDIPASSADHGTHTLLLDNPDYVEGNLFYPWIKPTGEFRLFGGVIRFRVIGVYMDGSKGEFWETQPLGLGV